MKRSTILWGLLASCGLLCGDAALRAVWADEGVAPSSPPAADPFQATVDDMMPLDVEEIRRLRRIIEDKQEAIHKIEVPSRTFLKTVAISLRAGAETPELLLLPGHAVGLEIVDSTGRPWPLASHTVGDPQRFHVIVPDIGAHNVLTITPQTSFGRSNLVLQLEGDGTLASLTLQAGTRIPEFHDRIRVMVQGRGPQAAAPQFVPPLSIEDPSLLAALDGLAPEGAVPLKVSQPLVENAWRRQDTLWVRGHFVLLSPAAEAQVAGAGELIAYRLPYTPALIIYDQAGNTRSVQVLNTQEQFQ